MTSRISHSRFAPFGVEAQVDLAAPLTEADKAELRRLYEVDGLLLIRGQTLSIEQQIEFGRIFGPVLTNDQDTFYVSNVREDGLFADLELMFHQDIAYVPAPFLSGCLHAVEVTEGVSPTRYASGFRAYEQMPDALRRRIADLKALFARPRKEDQPMRLTDSWSGDNAAIHALVQHQAGTGRPYLFVNIQQAALVAGLSQADSDALLQEIYGYLYAPENVYEHKWRTGDVVLWDNRAYNHARAPVTSGVRTLHRVTVAHLGYNQQYPADAPWYVDLQDGKCNHEALTAAE
jgi:taurine dioxygenase